MLSILALLIAIPALADGPADNIPDNVRRIPKLGIEVPAAVRAEFEQNLAALHEKIDSLTRSSNPRIPGLMPDVEIFYKVVHDALVYQEFFEEKEFDKAHAALAEGHKRADALQRGEAPWTTQRGLLVRGYRSKIDGSVQPFGLVIPDSYTFDGPSRFRTDIWFHGRGETLSELNFVSERMIRPGEFTPRDTIVLHPYGRYCNAFKFAGEVDVYEALDATRRFYKVDDTRVSVRGFSMGGAAAWHFAVHDPGRWFAANPGAGFAETPRFLDVFQSEKLDPPSYEKTLWNLYDCDKWAGNIRMVPTVAYSGEKDKQKQAADVMAQAVRPCGIELTHIIGMGAGHNYTPEAHAEVEARLDAIARLAPSPAPWNITFLTYSLRYNKCGPLTLDGLETHWQPAEIHLGAGTHSVVVESENCSAFTIDYPAGNALFAPSYLEALEVPKNPDARVELSIDNQQVFGPPISSDRSWHASFHKEAENWKPGPLPDDGLRKKHGLQGPVDDAFMDSFIIVKPSGTSPNAKFATWCNGEMKRAIEHWRRQFRGEPRVKLDTEINDADIASSNLILWGDAGSNAVTNRIADRLPIKWNREQVTVGDKSYPAANHALIAIYPNPLNPERYVVLNSGFTYRDYDYLNNARQTPKLPDWAVIDLDTPPNSRWPGKVVEAGFFDERWRLSGEPGP